MLAYSILQSDAIDDTQTSRQSLVFLHGILGRRINFRSIAKRWLQDKHNAQAILIDLRHHGDSLHMPGENTIEQTAKDVLDLLAQLNIHQPSILGHSFGGKIALKCCLLSHQQDTPLPTAFILDSAPGTVQHTARQDFTMNVLRTLRSSPNRFVDRDDFIQQLMSQGLAQSTAMWLAMNLKRQDDGSRVFPINLVAIEKLLQSYFTTDLWPALSTLSQTQLHLVIAENSEVYSNEERDRARQLAATHEHITTHMIADAGHWLHVDAPDAIHRLLVEHTR